jgi:hypothetical protein
VSCTGYRESISVPVAVINACASSLIPVPAVSLADAGKSAKEKFGEHWEWIGAQNEWVTHKCVPLPPGSMTTTTRKFSG